MYRFFVGIVVGIFLEQRYKLPNVETNLKVFDLYIRENYQLERKEEDDNNKKN